MFHHLSSVIVYQLHMSLPQRDSCHIAAATSHKYYKENLPVQLEEFRRQMENPGVSYPEYYNRKFHSYDSGNLDWQAVWELEAATAATAVRVFKEQSLSAQEACDAMRNSFLDGLQAS